MSHLLSYLLTTWKQEMLAHLKRARKSVKIFRSANNLINSQNCWWGWSWWVAGRAGCDVSRTVDETKQRSRTLKMLNNNNNNNNNHNNNTSWWQFRITITIKKITITITITTTVDAGWTVDEKRQRSRTLKILNNNNNNNDTNNNINNNRWCGSHCCGNKTKIQNPEPWKYWRRKKEEEKITSKVGGTVVETKQTYRTLNKIEVSRCWQYCQIETVWNIVWKVFYRTQVSLGSDLWVLMSLSDWQTICRLNWCDSGWWW